MILITGVWKHRASIIRDSCRIWSSWEAWCQRTARVAWDAWSTRILWSYRVFWGNRSNWLWLPLCNKNNLRSSGSKSYLVSCLVGSTVKLPTLEDVAITSWDGRRNSLVLRISKRISGVAINTKVTALCCRSTSTAVCVVAELILLVPNSSQSIRASHIKDCSLRNIALIASWVVVCICRNSRCTNVAEVVINVRTLPELKLIAIADRQVLNDVVLSKAISTRVIWSLGLCISCVAIDGAAICVINELVNCRWCWRRCRSWGGLCRNNVDVIANPHEVSGVTTNVSRIR